MSVSITTPPVTPTSVRLWQNQHVIAIDTTIVAGTSVVISRYVEIAAGATLFVGDDSDLEIL